MKHLLFVLCGLLPSLLFADNVTVEQAQSLAVDFFKSSAQTRGDLRIDSKRKICLLT